MIPQPRYAGLGSRFHAGLAHRYALLGIARHGVVTVDTVDVSDSNLLMSPEAAVEATSEEQRRTREAFPPDHVSWWRRGNEVDEDPMVLPDTEVLRRLESYVDDVYGQELHWKILGVEVLLMSAFGGRDLDEELSHLPPGRMAEPAFLESGLIDTGPSPVGSHATELAMLCLQRYARTFGVEASLPYVHTARVDLLVEDSKGITAWDHKTSAQGGSLGLAISYNQSMQGVGIRWLLKRLLGGGRLGYNFVNTGPSPGSSRESDRLPPLPALVAGFETTLIESRQRVDRYVGKALRYWPATPSRATCTRGPYGRCPFLDKCGAGIP